MKISKSKPLIGLAIAVALLLAVSYLFMAQQAQTQKRDRALPSTDATPSEPIPLVLTSSGAPPPPDKPEEPVHRDAKAKLPASSRGAYPLGTEAAKPDKVEGYSPPYYSHEGIQLQEGGETCSLATVVGSLPYSATGYTCDNVDDYEESYVFDCPYTSNSPDVVYSYTPSEDQCVDIDLGGSYYDTKVFVYENTCESAYLVACNDDYYPDYTSAIMGLSVYSGNTYYIVVDGYGGDCGDYLINISECVECDVVCPQNGIPEDEPICEDNWEDIWNGGCNSTPYVFEDVNCGDTICGTSGTYDYYGDDYRDTDWFRVEVATGNLTFTCVAEFPLLIFVIDAGSEDCVDYTILGNTTASPCDTATLSFAVSAGVYWLWVGPSVFTGVECGVEYVCWVDCEAPDLWYWKPDKPEQEFPAPSGMPDFDQNQDAWCSFCGPAAVANCLWWFNSVPPGMTPPDLIELLAEYFLTTCEWGTYVDTMQMGLDQYFEDYGFDLQETTFVEPDFYEMEDSLKVCQDIILLLGFWYWDPDSQKWFREGGHYVTMAGVCSESLKIAVSDPDNDGAVGGAPGRVRPPDHPGPGAYGPGLHNDPTYVSHDIYDSDLNPEFPSPGNPHWEINYPWPPPGKFTGMNVPEKFRAVSRPAPIGVQIFATEVEYAVMICPKPPETPENDDCEGAIEIYPPDCPDVQTVYGTTVGATIDCPGVLDWEAVWYKFTLTYDCNNVLVDYCPTNRDDVYIRGVVLYDECPADCPNYILYTGLQWVTCPSTFTDLTVWWNALPAGTYWLPVFVEDAAGNQLDFGFDICVEECFPEPGDNCSDPIMVELPAQLPYSDVGNYTCGRVDDYENTCLGYYDGGEDIIYQLTVTSAVDVDITMDPKGTTWTGMAIDDACPPEDPCMGFDTGSSGSRFLGGVHLEPGTYYIMVDTWPSPDCIPDFDLTIIEAAGPPENDSCVNATAIGDVTELPFSTTTATFDGPGYCQTAPNIWYCYTASCDGMAHIALCGSEYDTKLAVYDTCLCYPEYEDMLGCNDDACYKALQSELTIPVEQGRRYLVEVGGYSSNTGNGVLTCSCYVPPQGPVNDYCDSAIVLDPPECPATLVVDGTTIDAQIDCPGVLDWPAVWYTFELTTESHVFIDFCEMDHDLYSIGAVMFDECPPDCPNYILYSEGAFVDCPNGTYNGQLWYNNLPPGQYWLPIYVEDYDGNQYMDFSFGICIEEAVPCDVVCPPNGIPEDEPICEDDWEDIWNGGCNSTPYAFNQTLLCGDTLCGTSGTYLYYGSQYRDTDWLRVEVGDGDLTFACVAEFPLQTILIDAGSEDCLDYVVLDYRQVGECDTATISMWVPAGVYWLWVGPSVFSGVPCGKEYVMWVHCSPFGPQIAVTPTSLDELLNPTGACSSATQNVLISSVGGEDLDYSVAENPPVDWMEVSPTSGTLPPGQTETLDVDFDAGGMAEGDYYCDLEITHNDPSVPSPLVVPVHLEVELAPEIEVQPRVWMPVVPGCMMDEALRINNLGEGVLSFEISVSSNPPPLGAGKNTVREALEALQQAGRANPTIVPKEAFKVIGAKRSTVEYQSTAAGEGLLLSAGGGKQANILLVDDDGGLPGGTYTDVEVAYMDALDAGGYVYDYYVVDWTDPQSPGPDLATLQQYGCVIWFCGETWGYYGDDTVTPTDENNLAAYLDGGGNLFLSAEDYLYDMYPSAGSFSAGQFPYDYLHLASVCQDCILDPYTVYGVDGSVADGMQFDCVRCWNDPGVALWTDYLYTQAGAVDVFSVNYGDPSAIQYDAGTYKIVFTTTAFPGLVDGTYSYRADFMASIMDWFECAGPACPFTVYPESGDIPAESFFDVVLTFDGTMFEECVDDTITCYLTISSNDCDEPEVTVDVHAMSARGDVTKDCVINVADLVFLLNYIFDVDPKAPPPDPLCIGDVDRDGDVDSDDALYLASYLFAGGPPPEIPTAPKGDEETIQIRTVKPVKETPIKRK